MKAKRERGRKATENTIRETQALVRSMQQTAAVLAAWHPSVPEVGMLTMILANLAGTFNGQTAPDQPAGE